MTDQGLLLVLAGPSGVGKTTIARRLREHAGFVKITTCTTRKPRPAEEDGKSYHFLSRAEFEKRAEAGRFLEHAVVHGEHYGTPKDDVLREKDAGNVVVLDIDVQGAASVRKSGLEAVFIFLEPPDWDELLRRIEKRGSESKENIERRLETARNEMKVRDSFDAVIVNKNVDCTVEAVLAELAKKGHQV